MVTECPECGSAVRDGRTCGGCGWTLLRLAPSSVVSPTQRLVTDYRAPLEDERTRIADEAGALLSKLRERFTAPIAAPALVIAETTTPTCAGCSKPAEPAILRDCRLWHTECWDRLSHRVARTRWMR